MAVNFLLKRSGTASKRPDAASMALGELDLNYDAATGGIYYKDSNGAVVKVGPCQVSATAPNVSPAGSTGNSAGEFWYDTANSALKVWNGTSWVVATVTSGFLPLSGGTMTGNITFQDAGEGIIFADASTIDGITDSTSTVDSTLAASATAVNTLRGDSILKSVLTTSGDMIYASAASTPSILSIGSTGQVLTVSGGLPVWATGMIGATDSLTPFNTKLGYNAGLGFNATTLRNTAVGYAALDLETTGDDLTAIGYNALGTTNNGTSWTVAIGSSAGENIAHAAHNSVYIGWRAGQNATAGISNVAIGSSAGRTLGGSNNVIVGQGAGAAAAVANNVFVGNNAGAASTGSGNVYIGAGAGDVSSATSNNIAIGLNALGGSSTASGSVAIGFESLLAATTGIRNTAVGFSTLRALNTGQENTVVGYNAGLVLTSGSANVFVGNDVGDAVTTGTYNTAVGSTALGSATTANSNTAIGWGALNATTGASNTAVGKGAGVLVSTGTNNILIGDGAGDAITTGASNTILGDITGTATLSNNLILAAGTTIKLQVNENGAVGVGSTPAYGSSGQILMSNGTGSAPTWTSSAGLLPNYGEFLSTATQTNLDTTNGNATTFDTTTLSRNVSIVSNSRITFAQAGVYNIQISMQVTKTDSGTDTFTFWFKKNGVNIDNSTTSMVLGGNNDSHIAALNILESFAANDYIELWWYSPDANVQLLYAGATAPYPATPSVILTAVPVGA